MHLPVVYMIIESACSIQTLPHADICRWSYFEPYPVLGCATGDDGMLSLAKLISDSRVGEAGPVVMGDEGGTPSKSDKAGILGFLFRSLEAVSCLEGLYPGDFRSPLYLFC